MITALYAGLLALLLVFLSLNVIRIRRSDGISTGDGGNKLLARRVRAQGNLAEYAPVFLITLFLIEGGGTSGWAVHALGVLFLLGRVMHATAFSSLTLRPFCRVGGMVITLTALILGGLGAILAALGVIL